MCKRSRKGGSRLELVVLDGRPGDEVRLIVGVVALGNSSLDAHFEWNFNASAHIISAKLVCPSTHEPKRVAAAQVANEQSRAFYHHAQIYLCDKAQT